MKNKSQNSFKAPIYCFYVFLLIIILLFIQFCYLGLSKNVYGINMKDFASKRNTVASIIPAKRGTIYDFEGNILAHNISSYTLIAYLDPSRTKDEKNPDHVVDKDYTATKLASILGEENYEYILSRLNSKAKQVEFGSVGKNLTELKKLAIEELDLPGISFVETTQRYYPNGNFASYIIGYAKQYTKINVKVGDTYDLYDYYKNYFDNYQNITIEVKNEEVISVDGYVVTGLKEGTSILIIKTNGDTLATIIFNITSYDVYQIMDDTIVGELGIESKFESELQGVDRYTKYQRDKYGYKIPDTPEEKKEAIDGYDIYLTIDSNIQRFTESAVKQVEDEYDPEWTMISVLDAKTGDILASSTNPSYNPNNLPSNMSYQSPLISYTYEPGSVMKIYTYMCAIETGKYDGSKKYLSGSYDFGNNVVIHDWDKKGWGYLTYDAGFSYSSNVAIINIIKDYIDDETFKKCLYSFGFGDKTGIELSGEESGKIGWNYENEKMSTGFGQGISTTAIQQLQALTIIANNGVMLKPHIISKIVNTETKEEIITPVEKSEPLVSSSTITKIKDLMETVILPNSPTGARYYIEDYDIIGKTGTAQIYENGKYLTGSNDYIVSVALMYPKDDPEIIIYAAAKKPVKSANTALPEAVKELIKNISKYKGMFNNKVENTVDVTNTLSSYVNKNVTDVKSELENNKLNVVVIGNGNKVTRQYPKKDTEVIEGDRIFLLTNSIDNITIPNMKNWSRYDVSKFCELALIECNFEGFGYVVSQSLKEGTIVNGNTKLDILLGNIKS